MLVDPQLVGLAIVGHVDVNPPVAIEVRGHDAERGTKLPRYAGRGGDVREGSVAVVVEEVTGLRRIEMRRTIVRLAVDAVAAHVGVGRVVQVVAHEQVQPAVTVVVDKGGRTAPTGIVRAARFRHVCKGAVAVVPKQLILPQRGHVEIDAAVVVVIARSHAHAVPVGVDAALVGHVREPKRARPIRVNLQIVPEQPAFERQWTFGRDERLTHRLPGPEHPPLRYEHIEIAIVVVVKQGDARPHVFGVVPLAGHAVEVHEVETGFRSVIDKPLGRRARQRLTRFGGVDLIRCGVPARKRSPAGRQQRGNDEHAPRLVQHLEENSNGVRASRRISRR